MFVSPRHVAPLVSGLANQIRPHGVEAVCGPLLGGAFLAQAVATELGAGFYFAEPVTGDPPSGLLQARYRLPAELRRRANGVRMAIVDDVISAGSSVRATATALTEAGARTVVVGTLLLLGAVARDHFAALGIPIESLGQRELTLWQPESCPLCLSGASLEESLR